MFRLKELQKKQQQAAAAAAASNTTNGTDAPATTTTAASNTTEPTEVKRQNSNDLKEIRKQKSKESYFSLKSKQSSEASSNKRANPAELRAQKDIDEMELPIGCKVHFKDSDDILNFQLDIIPSDGLYQGATFKFSINIPNTYPYDPPKVHCDTLVYHPNIDLQGHVCLNILRQDWMPVLNIGTVIFGMMTLFLEPNPEDPLNIEAAQLMMDNRKNFEANVKQSLRGGYIANRQFPKLL
ncbi:ubiquitin-conjugating enzyme E2 M [Cavenderia fasciculata]|uniref:Ubiquitin-conjugating enzyme E2 M n=1 Tax=Cavenderia fasciculata TaxID=261658 RepID=F4QAU4_CACFS|nr:ubiquitin-conjugating enzyme E2 M [Cavenderia fasciculata]EGG15003.1 ubiquitin-conjugating enzyme E2 M [Cavenderia fasciculata]|eukprot:XP_004351723.1 ubiquitin-conjugating enzyme E2 M [Cavenderia fasciculata]